MIEVTCGACGTAHRFAESDVPAGGRTTTCTACKAKLVVPGAGAKAPAPPLGGNTGDIIDLADLPAPKRASPLAGAAPAATRPAPKSALAGAAPSAAKPAPPSPLDLGDINLGLDLGSPVDTSADLPAPVGPSPTKAGAARPAVPSIPSVPSLPPNLPPMGSPTKTGIGPGVRPGVKAPAVPAVPAIQKAPASTAGITDLPAPKRASTPPVGVPTTTAGLADFPAPRRAGTPAIGVPTTSPAGLADLPAPKRPSGPSPIATPPPDLGAGGIDLPAPKGFFDDLPAPVGPATGLGDLPAPKGFFDDLPAPASTKSTVDLPAPKGFFDDLPGPATRPADLPAPKGFFDDIPGPAAPALKADTPRPGKPLDLDDLDLAPHSQMGPLPAPPLELEPLPAPAPAPAAAVKRTPAAPPAGRNVPALELPDVGADPYGGLDLPTPGASAAAPFPAPVPPPPASGGVVSFKPAARAEPVVTSAPAGPAPIDLDIEAAATKSRPQASGKPAPARKDAAAEPAPARAPMSQRTRTAAMVGLLVVVAGGGGGYLYYKHWKKQKHKGDQATVALANARTELASGAPGHWDRAAQAADNAAAMSPGNADAIAIAAEASYAGVLDEGTDADRRTKLADARAQALVAQSMAGTDVDKALALQALVGGQTDRAVQRLGDLIKRAPTDPDAPLYLGWAHLAAHAYADASADFDRALKASPARDVPALYGRGRAKLALGDRDGARADFDAILKKDPRHVGAEVGTAAAAPAAAFEQRERQLADVLARKDLAQADPRAVALAWTLSGDDARVAGRLDAAGERYKHALELDKNDLAALVGHADLALRAGFDDKAGELVTRALAVDAGDVDTNLIAAQIDLRRKRADDAMARLDKLAQREPPIAAAAQKARLQLLRGTALQAAGKLDDALAAFLDAAKAAGDGDVTPTIAAVQLLTQRAAAADQAKDARSAAAFRQQAEDLIAPLQARAQDDPAMAVTIGVAYLQSGAPDKAEPFLRSAVAKKPGDVEALFQLATAQALEGKKPESLATRQQAFDADPSRLDVGGALAHDDEEAGFDDKAGAMYDKLVARADVTADIRARAGVFWARTGDIAKARAQGDALVKADPEDPAGLYLVGEGLIADGKGDAARRALEKATMHNPPAQYLDALGRAYELIWHQTDDSRYRDEAVHSYEQASGADPKLFDPQLGRGRLLVVKNDPQRALEPLNNARAIRPDDPEVAYYLGVALHGSDRDKEAVPWLVRANQLHPRAEAYKLLGEIYYNGDRANDAASAIDHAIKLALDQEKAGQPVEWLTDVLYEQVQIANARNDMATLRRAGQMYLDRSPKNAARVAEVKNLLLGAH
jgi:tetratricopeptide (TPR) repeat protein